MPIVPGDEEDVAAAADTAFGESSAPSPFGRVRPAQAPAANGAPEHPVAAAAGQKLSIEAAGELAFGTPTRQRMKQSAFAAADENPDQFAEATRLGRQFGVAPRVAKQDIEAYSREAARQNDEWELARQRSPGLARFVSDPDNAAIVKDDMERAARIDRWSANYSTWNKVKDGFFEYSQYVNPVTYAPVRAGLTGFSRLNASAATWATRHGLLDGEKTADFIAYNNQNADALDAMKPDTAKEFEKLTQEEGGDVNRAVERLVGGYRDLRRGNIKRGLLEGYEGGKATVGETVDMVVKGFRQNPGGLAYSIMENMPSSLPAMIAATAAAPVVVGAATYLGASATLASILGYTAVGSGVFAGEYPVEFGSQAMEDLQAQGIDTRDPAALKRAFADGELMDRVDARAGSKALGTAGLDAVASPLSGIFLRNAPVGLSGRAALMSRAGRGMMDLMLEFFGEAGSEIGGQALREDGDVSKIDFGQGIAEGMTSLGQSVAEIARNTGESSVKRVVEKGDTSIISSNDMQQAFNEALGTLSHRAGDEFQGPSLRTGYNADPVEATEEVSLEAEHSVKTLNQVKHLVEIAQEVREFKLTERKLPEKTKELIDTATNGDPDAAVYFQTRDFDEYWQGRGITPEVAAGEIMGDGGKAYRLAKRSGTSIKVLMKDYVTALAPTEHFEPMIGIVRTEDGGKSTNEAVKFMRSLPATLDELAKEQDTSEKKSAESAAEVKRLVKEQIAPHFSDDVAERYATLWESQFRAQGERAGIDPLALYQRYRPQIQRFLTNRVTRGNIDSMDVLIDRLRNQDIPSASDAYGQSLTDFLREQGGIVPTEEGADLLGMDVDAKGIRGLFSKKLVNEKGMMIDRAAEIAHEAGFMPERSIRDLLDRISAETRGDMSFSAANERSEIAAVRANLLELKDQLAREGLSPDTMTNQQIKDELAKRYTQETAEAEVPIEQEQIPDFVTEDSGTPEEGVFEQRRDPKDLIIHHNITAENLRHAERMGGLAVPSLAITRKSNAITGYGDITLIGSKEMADPKGYAKTKVYGADIYSPRYPSIEYKITSADLKALNDKLAKFQKATGDSPIFHEDLRTEGVRGLTDSAAVMSSFLSEKGINAKLGKDKNKHEVRRVLRQAINENKLDGEFSQYADDLFQGLSPVERLFQGFTYSGNRRYKAHTLDNVVRILKKELRGGEGFNYGVGSLRAQYTPQFRSVEAINKNKGRLVTREEFEAIKKEIDTEFWNIANKLAPLSAKGGEFGFGDTVIHAMEEMSKIGISRALEEYGIKGASESVQREIGEFLTKLRSLPTEYFEAKILRGVGLEEFAGAVVPEGTPKSVTDMLERRGIEVATYARGDEAARRAAVESLSDKLSENVLFQNYKSPMGAFFFGPNRQANIQLLKNADVSTFLHESAHFFLEVMRDLAEREVASTAMKDDAAILLDWFGVDSWDKIERKHHEQFAEGFEQFLLEGKAPSQGLRKAFAGFRKWLMRIYGSLKRLRVPLTDDVRGFMARMLATDSEISQAIIENDLQQEFSDAPVTAPFGMTGPRAERWNKSREKARITAWQQVDARLLSNYQRERAKARRADRAAFKEEAIAEVDNLRSQKALALLQKGEQPNGEALADGVTATKIDRQSVIDLMGEEFVKKLPRGTTSTKEGTHANILANSLGYAGAEEFLIDMANTPSRAVAIEAAVEAKMLQKHGDPLLDEALPEHVLEALHNENRSDMIYEEFEQLAASDFPAVGEVIKRATRAPTPKAEIRARAERMLEEQVVGDIRPHSFVIAENQSRKAVGELVAAGDIDAASDMKERELLNHYLYKAAVEAQENVKKQETLAKKFFKADDSLKDSRDMDYILVGREVLSAFNMGPADESLSRSSLADLKKYDIDKTNFQVLQNMVLRTTEGAGPYKSVSYGKFLDLKETTESLWALARDAKTIEIEGQRVSRDEMIAKLTAKIDEIRSLKKSEEFTRSKSDTEKQISALHGGRAMARRVESWCDAFDFKDPLGPFKQIIFNPISEGSTQYRLAIRDAKEKLVKILEPIQKDFGDREIRAPEIGHVFRGMHELLHALLHTGNKSNLQKLLRGGQGGAPWAVSEGETLIDTSQWDSFMARMRREGILRPEHYEAAQAVWDLMEELKPGAQRAHKQIFGHHFGSITAQEFTVDFPGIGTKTYRGGYVPARVDSSIVEDAAIKRERENIEEMNNGYAWPSAGRGPTMQRIEAYAAPLELNMRAIYAHVDWALRFTHIEPRVRDVAKIITNKEFREALKSVDESAAQMMLVPWLQRTAKQLNFTPSDDWTGWQFWRRLRRLTGEGRMLFNFTNALQQYTGPLVANVQVPAKYLRNSTAGFIKDRKNFAQEIARKSGFMDTRLGTSIFEMEQTFDDIILNPSKYEKFSNFTSRNAYILQRIAQNQVDCVVWAAAYDHASETMTEEQAIRHADHMVRSTQGSNNPEDIARFEAGTHFTKLFTQFSGYFNMKANMLGTEWVVAVREMGLGKITNKQGAMRIFHSTAIGLIMSAALSAAIVKLMGGGIDDDDDGYLDDLAQMFFMGTFREATPMIPYGFGQAINYEVNLMNDNPYDDQISASPAVQLVEEGLRAPKSVYKAIAGEGSKKRAIRDSLSLITLVAGAIFKKPVPATALARPLGYLSDVQEGEVGVEGPVDFTRGLITGKGSH